VAGSARRSIGLPEPAEALLADGEDNGNRRRLGQDALAHGHGGRDRDRVVADPGTAQPAVAPRDASHRGLVEHVVNVNQHGEAVRRRAERPHQVAGAVHVSAPRCLRQALAQPVDAHPLVAGAAVQFGQQHGVRGDRRRIEGCVSHVTWPNTTEDHEVERSVPFD
jgi:hypothetical protein